MIRKITAFAACALLSYSAMAQNALPQFTQSRIKAMDKAAVVDRLHYDNGTEVLIRETEDGFRFKQLAPLSRGEKVSKQLFQRSQRSEVSVMKKAKGTMTWAESFEGWDGDDFTWLPEGWERKSNGDLYLGTMQTWFVNYQNNMYCPEPIDGQYYLEILFSGTSRQNEAVMTPWMTVQEGDKFSCYIMTNPFFMFDISKLDTKINEFTQRVNVFNTMVYIQEEGSTKWTELYNMWNTYKDWSVDDLQALSEETGTHTVIRLLKDMSAYVGKKVRYRILYTGKDGNSVFVDHLELGKPYLTADYYSPVGTFNLGMTQDYKVPVTWSYYPDGEPLTWYNLSSTEATTSTWTYGESGTGKPVTSNEQHLKLTYGFTPETEGNPENRNIYDTPILEVSADGFDSGTYQATPNKFKVGGRTHVTLDGEQYLCGGATYNTDNGYTAALVGGTPVCGHEEGVDPSFWYEYEGMSQKDFKIDVVGIYNAFNTPRKAYKVRGLWVHGIGEIGPDARIVASIHTLDEDGAINEVPIASGILDTKKILHCGSAASVVGKDYDYITLPFEFADPVEINEAVFVRINGFCDGDVKYFAPLQNHKPEESLHGFVRLVGTSRTTGQQVAKGMLPLSYVTNEYGACVGSFYITMEMAYGDCDDWGHREVIEEDRPKLELENGLLQAHTMGSEMYNRLCRSAFYDAPEGASEITLYCCVGQMEQGEDPDLTTNIIMTFSADDLGKEIDLSNSSAVVKFFDATVEDYTFVATAGKLLVTKNGEGNYNVELNAYDSKAQTSFGVIYQDKPWIDFNAKTVVTNHYAVGIDGSDEHEITRVVINTTDENYTYLAVYADEAEPVRIKVANKYIDGRLHGFSQAANDDIEITFRGKKYSYVTTTLPNTVRDGVGIAMGGNVFVSYATDGEDNYLTLDFTLYAVKSEDEHNVVGHFAGECELDVANGIITLTPVRKSDAKRYNLNGQLVGSDFRGIVIENGKKHK